MYDYVHYWKLRAWRYYWLMLAESHLTRRLFGSMVRRISALAYGVDGGGGCSEIRQPEHGAGEVFVEVTERNNSSVLDFSSGRNESLAEPKDRTRRRSSQRLHFGDQKLGDP